MYRGYSASGECYVLGDVVFVVFALLASVFNRGKLAPDGGRGSRSPPHVRILPLAALSTHSTRKNAPGVPFPKSSSPPFHPLALARARPLGSAHSAPYQLHAQPIRELNYHSKIFLIFRIHFFCDAVKQVRQVPA